MAKELAKELISAGVHFGHSANRWNPKMAPFIFAKRGQIHIIDVRKTLAGLVIAKKLLTEVVSQGKDVYLSGPSGRHRRRSRRRRRNAGCISYRNDGLAGL